MDPTDDRTPDREARPDRASGEDLRGLYIISVAAELVGVHPQTLRIYERKGLLSPSRTSGNTRRYSQRDIRQLETIQRLTQEGINLAGVKMIVELQLENERLRSRMRELRTELERARRRAADEVERVRREHRAEIVPLSEVHRYTVTVRGRRGPIAVGPSSEGREGPRGPIAVGPGG